MTILSIVLTATVLASPVEPIQGAPTTIEQPVRNPFTEWSEMPREVEGRFRDACVQAVQREKHYDFYSGENRLSASSWQGSQQDLHKYDVCNWHKPEEMEMILPPDEIPNRAVQTMKGLLLQLHTSILELQTDQGRLRKLADKSFSEIETDFRLLRRVELYVTTALRNLPEDPGERFVAAVRHVESISAMLEDAGMPLQTDPLGGENTDSRQSYQTPTP